MDITEIIKYLNGYKDELGAILSRFTKNHSGIRIKREDNRRLREIVNELCDLVRDHIPQALRYARIFMIEYQCGMANYEESSTYSSVEKIQGAVSALIKRIERFPDSYNNEKNKLGLEDQRKYEAIELIINRFHLVVRQLRERYDDRHKFEVEDEYDVQDLFHALLNLYYDDIRKEEWTPSYAGSNSSIDFLLPEINTVVEIKRTRKSLTTKIIGEQLIIDIAKYKKHPQCKQLVCFVYDPEGRISNPRGLESDLSKNGEDIDVQVIIVPKQG